MDSPDALNIPATAPITQQAVVPAFTIISSSTATSLPRSPNRPPVPLSTFERLPTDIHTAVVEELIRGKVDSLSYKSACRLARASPVFTTIVQKRLYLEIVLEGKENACKWLESDSTIRGEFATRMLILRGEEGQVMGAGVVEKVLVLQTSALKELGLFHVESVKSSSLDPLISKSPAVIRIGEADVPILDLVHLSLDNCNVKMDDSSDKPAFRLTELAICRSAVPSPYLSDLVGSSSTSLRLIQIEIAPDAGKDVFDWNPIASATLPQLRTLHLTGPHIPSLHNLLSGCESLKELRLCRYNGNPAISDATIPQLSKELASLPNPTLKRCRLLLCYVGRSGGVITLQEVEDLIALLSLANLENLDLYVMKKDWNVAEVETLRANKGRKGKLAVQVELL